MRSLIIHMSSSGARRANALLAASETLDRPVDTFLQLHWVTGQPVHTIHPNGVQELAKELGGSTIQVKPAPAPSWHGKSNARGIGHGSACARKSSDLRA